MRNLRILITGIGGELGRMMVQYLNKFDFYIVGTDSQSDFICVPKTEKRYIVPKADEKNYIDCLNSIIENDKIDFLILQTDVEIREVAKNKDKIKTKFWLPDYETIVTMQDKYKCNKIWEKARIPVPKSEIVTSENQLRDSIWIRPLNLVCGGGKNALYAPTKSIAKEWIDKNNGWGGFTMNEYLPNNIYGFDSLWDKGELIGYSLKERLMYLSKENDFVGFGTGIAKTCNNKEAVENSINAIKAIVKKPDGVFSVDLRGNKDNIPCITEINPGRFLTTSLLLFAKTDYDLPLDYINRALGNKVEKRKSFSEELYILSVKGQARVLKKEEMEVKDAKTCFN